MSESIPSTLIADFMLLEYVDGKSLLTPSTDFVSFPGILPSIENPVPLFSRLLTTVPFKLICFAS